MKSLALILMTIFTITTFAYAESPKDLGYYAELSGANIYNDGPQAMGGEVGMLGYLNNHMSVRAGLAFLASDGYDNYFGGFTAGVRYSLGDRLCPFVGAGLFFGEAQEETTDANGNTTTKVTDLILSTYPEAGIHWWVTKDIRVTGLVKYHFTSKGDAFPVYGASLAIFY